MIMSNMRSMEWIIVHLLAGVDVKEDYVRVQINVTVKWDLREQIAMKVRIQFDKDLFKENSVTSMNDKFLIHGQV